MDPLSVCDVPDSLTETQENVGMLGYSAQICLQIFPYFPLIYDALRI